MASVVVGGIVAALAFTGANYGGQYLDRLVRGDHSGELPQKGRGTTSLWKSIKGTWRHGMKKGRPTGIGWIRTTGIRCRPTRTLKIQTMPLSSMHKHTQIFRAARPAVQELLPAFEKTEK